MMMIMMTDALDVRRLKRIFTSVICSEWMTVSYRSAYSHYTYIAECFSSASLHLLNLNAKRCRQASAQTDRQTDSSLPACLPALSPPPPPLTDGEGYRLHQTLTVCLHHSMC